MSGPVDGEDVAIVCKTLMGDDPEAYQRALQRLLRQPRVFEAARPSILKALSGASRAQRFDLAFALAAMGSRDPAVLAALAETATPLGPIDALEPFCGNPRIARARLTADSQVTGELVLDAAGTTFLAPEEENRGGGMGAIRILAWSHDAAGHRLGEAVNITGFFKAGVGLVVDTVRNE